MSNKVVRAAIDRRQLDGSYAAIKDVQAQADKRMQRVKALLKESTRSSSDRTREERRS